MKMISTIFICLLVILGESRGESVKDTMQLQSLFSGINYTNTKSCTVETIYLDPASSGSSVRTVNNVTYLDGFGRKLQEIQVGGVPGGTGDIILRHVYGVLGRVEREYLPYNKTGNNGAFDPDVADTSNWDIYGLTEAPYAFTRTEYDNSPLDRVVKQTGPGKNWHVNHKGVTTGYGMNQANEVKLYRVSGDGSDRKSVV